MKRTGKKAVPDEAQWLTRPDHAQAKSNRKPLSPMDAAAQRRESGPLRQTVDMILRIAQSVSIPIGDHFLSRLTEHVVDALSATGGAIALISPEDRTIACTQAFIVSGKQLENVRYSVVGTPCEEVVTGQTKVFNGDAQQRFPSDKMLAEFDFESYAGTPLVDQKGTVIGLVAVLYNRPLDRADLVQSALQIFAARAVAEIERQKADASLAASQRLQQLILDSVGEGIHGLSTDGKIVFENPAALAILGWTKGELLGKNGHSLIHHHRADGRPYPVHECPIYKTLRDGKTRQVADEVFFRKDGTSFPVEYACSPLRSDSGDITGAVITFRDITKRKTAEDALRESRRELLTLMSNLPGMVYRCRNDPNWTMEFVSAGATALTGYAARDLIESSTVSYGDLIHPDDRARIWEETQGAVRRRRPFEMVYRIRTADNGEKWVWERGRAIRSDDGEILALEGFITDITERKQLEARFLRTQRMESIGTLAGGIAHDLNNVLAPILVSIELLKENLADRERMAVLDRLEESTLRGAALVRQVLTFARGVEGVRRPIDPTQMLREIESMVHDTFPKNIEFECIAPPGLSSVNADSTQLHQVLTNLCVNARDAMPNGGRLVLKLENSVIDEDALGMNPHAKAGDYLMFEVRDTGVGIPRELQERIFEPFFTTKDVGQGTGLGLSTALTIVKGHGGFIKLQSEPGNGTAFQVFLPALPSTESCPDEAAETTRLPHGEGETVLVVDDEENIRILLQSTLEFFGYRVILAENGEEAVAAYSKHRTEIAVVLIDMAMPVMDGPATVSALRAVDPAVKIICCSGLPGDASAKAALAVDHCISKPYSAETILRTLRAILD